MFGYVMPYKDELKIKEFRIFKAYYCGLCKTIEKKNFVSSMFLTYDMVFLSLLLSSIYSDKIQSKDVFCRYKLKKVSIITDNEFTDYAADMNILLSKRKFIDDYEDNNNAFYKAISLIIKNKPNSVALSKVNKIDYYLSEIKRLEKSKCSNVDEIADCFGRTTSEIFSFKNDDNVNIMKDMGYNIGKWIYTIDAYDDLIDDINKKNYNPFIYNFNYNNQEPYKFREYIKEAVEFSLLRSLDECLNAFEQLTINKNKEILKNILYYGMNDKIRKVIEGRQKNEKSIRGPWCKGELYSRGDKASL